ncbi:MAG: response regulator [Anaerolineae bacterium]
MTSILLVEDHPIMRPTLRDILKLEGYTVVTAVNGEEALCYLEDSPTDLVITDFEMPVMNGLDLLRALRSNARYAQLPVVIFTATTDPDVCDAALSAGVDAFLIRPITPQDLFDTVRRLLAEREDEDRASTL